MAITDQHPKTTPARPQPSRLLTLGTTITIVVACFFLTLIVSAIKSRRDTLHDFDTPFLAVVARRPFHWTLPQQYGERFLEIPQIAQTIKSGEWDYWFPRSIEFYSKFTIPKETYYVMAATKGFIRTLPHDFIDPNPGVYEQWLKEPQGMMVEARLMRAKKWKVGEVVTIDPIFGRFTAKVIGVFRGNISPRVIAHVEHVRTIAGAEADQADVIVAPCHRELREAAVKAADQMFATEMPLTLRTSAYDCSKMFYGHTFVTILFWLFGTMIAGGFVIACSLFSSVAKGARSLGRTFALTWGVGIGLGCLAPWILYRRRGVDLQFGVDLKGWGIANTTVPIPSLLLSIGAALVIALGCALLPALLHRRRPDRAAPRRSWAVIGGVAISILWMIGMASWYEGLHASMARSAPLENQTIYSISRREIHQLSTETKLKPKTHEQVLAALDPSLIATGSAGPLISTEYVVPMGHRFAKSIGIGIAGVRGIDPVAYELHGVHVEGAKPGRGEHAILIGRHLVGRYEGFTVGGTIPFGDLAFRIVGVIDSPGTIFESEIWGDRQALTAALGIEEISLVNVRLKRADEAGKLAQRLAAIKGQKVESQPEQTYYDHYSPGPTRFRLLLRPIVMAVVILLAASIVLLVSMGLARHRPFGAKLDVLIGGVLGLLVNLASSMFTFLYRDRGGNVYFRLALTPRIWIFALTLIALLALVVSVLSSLRRGQGASDRPHTAG